MINLMIVLIGFFSKQFVLYSALQNGYYFISLIAIIVSVISASYYLKIIKVLHTDHDYFEAKLLEGAVEGAKVGECLTADIPTFAFGYAQPLLLTAATQRQKAKAKGEAKVVTFTTLTLKKQKLGVEPRVGVSLSQSQSYDPILLDLDLEQSKTTLTNTHSFLISSLTLIILLFFIKPSIILNSTQLLSLCAPYEGFCCMGFCLIPLVYLTVNKFSDTSCWYSRLFKLITSQVWIAEYKCDK